MHKNKYFSFSGGHLVNLIYVSLAVFLLLLMPSCYLPKHSAYFKNLEQKDTTLTAVSIHAETTVVPGDILSITVTSLNPLEDALFNGSPGSGALTAGAANAAPVGRTVQPDGQVTLHRIGKLQVAGFTRRQVAAKVEEELLPFLKEPLVQVVFLNHKVTVLGEVAKPGIVNMPEEKLSVIDALVLTGDLTSNARRDNVTIIRDSGNEREVRHVNLENSSVFSSEWYYLKPDDIVLVSSDLQATDKEERRRRLQTTLSLVAAGASLLVIILDRVIK